MLVFINLCRELKLSKVSLTSASPLRIESIQQAGARQQSPGWNGRRHGAGVKEESQVAGKFLALLSVGESRHRDLTSCDTPSGELAQKQLLGHACANPFSRANRKISEHQSGTTIGLGTVKVVCPLQRSRSPSCQAAEDHLHKIGG